jgi:DNA-binding transcriptional LysR family regulator
MVCELDQQGAPGSAVDKRAQVLRFRQLIIRHLPFFVAVAEEENFHRAAKRISITQSALSRRIQALEDELGVTLFDRTMKGVTLTPIGKTFYADAQGLLAHVDRSVDRLRAAARGEAGLIRLGLNEGATRSALITSRLREFAEASPNVRVELYSMFSEEQLDALKNETIDAGFLYDFHSDSEWKDSLETRLLQEERMLLALYEGHPLCALPEIELQDLRDEKLIWSSRSRGRHVYDKMIAAFHAAGETPNILIEVTAVETTIDFVLCHLGIGFVPETLRLPPGVMLRPVKGFNIHLNLHICWRRSGLVSPGLKRLVSMIMEPRV